MGDLFDGYRLDAAWDEVRTAGAVGRRPRWPRQCAGKCLPGPGTTGGPGSPRATCTPSCWSRRTVPDAGLVALAAQARSRLTPYDVVLPLSETVRDRVADQPGARPGCLPGHRARHASAATCIPSPSRRSARARGGSRLARRLVGVRPDQRPPGGAPARDDCPRAGLRGVPPRKGGYAGGGSQSLGVRVEVTRLA